jgi:hypothetical protein
MRSTTITTVRIIELEGLRISQIRRRRSRRLTANSISQYGVRSAIYMTI